MTWRKGRDVYGFRASERQAAVPTRVEAYTLQDVIVVDVEERRPVGLPHGLIAALFDTTIRRGGPVTLRMETSGRPDSSETYAIHAPSGQ